MKSPREPSRNFFDEYTRGFDRTEFQRLFTRDTADAYHYFSRGLDLRALAQAPWYRRWPTHIRLFFVAFAMRLSPGRRVLYAFAVVAAVFGLLDLFDGFGTVIVFLFPMSLDLYLPQWADGMSWMVLAFLAIQLLVLMEVADRLSLKSDLEIARDIQLAMLPRGSKEAGDARVFGFTRPADTVGGDFYDILPLADGRLMVAVGDVAGKGSPAALLWPCCWRCCVRLWTRGWSRCGSSRGSTSRSAGTARGRGSLRSFSGSTTPPMAPLSTSMPAVGRHRAARSRRHGAGHV